jgi:L-alanine-DL-glutamate epimerase-like enolase superfamily enzyme
MNIKLDKAGGLTAALALARAVRAAGLEVMIGCMVATSLAIAPALLLGTLAKVIDLDGPLWLARDRTPGLSIRAGRITPPPAELWG